MTSPSPATCRHGHPLTSGNYYIRKDTGGRQCARCVAIHGQERRQRLGIQKRPRQSGAEKPCIRCGRVLPVTEFTLLGFRRDGSVRYRGRCRPCHSIANARTDRQRRRKRRDTIAFERQALNRWLLGRIDALRASGWTDARLGSALGLTVAGVRSIRYHHYLPRLRRLQGLCERMMGVMP